jgi:hypothetical protein
MIIALIIIIVVALISAGVAAVAFFGLWNPFGKVVGSGTFESQKKDFMDFTIVEVGGGFEVEILQSSSYDITITADDNMFNYIEVSKTGDTLTIGLKWGYDYQNVSLKAKIKMPDLYGLMFSGGTHGTAQEFSSSHDLELSLSGGSIVSVEGEANDLTASGSGGSQLDLSEFPVHDATVNLSGGSHATIHLDGRLEGTLSGGSHLKYLGDPNPIDVSTSGGSTVGPKQ